MEKYSKGGKKDILITDSMKEVMTVNEIFISKEMKKTSDEIVELVYDAIYYIVFTVK